MAEYINREELLKYKEEMWQDRCDHMVVRVTNIMYLPKEYVVSVVRCSQCKKRYTTECALWFSQLDDKQYFCGAMHNDDFYCSYGEKK